MRELFASQDEPASVAAGRMQGKRRGIGAHEILEKPPHKHQPTAHHDGREDHDVHEERISGRSFVSVVSFEAFARDLRS
jgi:hypothetical protein